MPAAATPGAGAGLVLAWPASFKLDIGRAADANRNRTDLIARRRSVVHFDVICDFFVDPLDIAATEEHVLAGPSFPLSR